jgi:acyl-CoA synthetase (AMP-forming)/AMP-acid ligase II
MSTEFPRDIEKRQEHLVHLQTLLNYPIVVTTDELVPEFCGWAGSNLLTTSYIEAGPFAQPTFEIGPEFTKTLKDTAVLMLSQSSDGKAKAICLTHGQILASIQGKVQLHGTMRTDIFLAWSGLDHVSNLIEVHLHAIFLGAIQVLFPARLAISNPLRLLQILDRYHISYTYTPDFFLKALIAALDEHEQSDQAALQIRPSGRLYDLSNLKALITQGVLGNLSTNHRVTELLLKHGAPESFLRSGFGMTEFCGSAIYDVPYPESDTSDKENIDVKLFLQNTRIPRSKAENLIGTPVHTISIRIVDEDHYPVPHGESGMLEVSGLCVFSSYYNDISRTNRMFTRDGWFRTGDLGRIDEHGRVVLDGRFEDKIAINGKHYHPQDIEGCIRQQNIPGIKLDGIVAFSFRASECDLTSGLSKIGRLKEENLVVVYAMNFPHTMTGLVLDTEHRIVTTVLELCGIIPYRVLGVKNEFLPRTGGGRFSNMLVKRAFLRGEFDREGE